jgi:hypothetical protein
MSVYAELEPVFITGDFHVNDKNQNWTITETKPLELGSWINQGLPFYKDWVNYEYTLNTTDPEGKYKLGLSKWSGSVCEIIVNGVSAGLIMGEPFTEDISRNLIDGENKIQIKVYGTLRNVWGPFHQDATPGIVTPWSWKFPPENQPAPEKYKLYDYGLWTNPEIVNYRQ